MNITRHVQLLPFINRIFEIKGCMTNIHYFCRGEWIVPNFEEIWPSGKPRRKGRGPGIPTKGPAYIEHAMKTGIPGERDKDFTTVGKPKV